MDLVPEQTIRQAASGDVAAFEQIYKAYAPYVYNVARRVAKLPEDAEEITQEVFLTLHRKLQSFRFQSSLKTWVYRMTINTAVNYGKSQTRHQKIDEAAKQEQHVTTKPDQHKEEYNKHLVNKLLDALGEEQRICVILRELEGLSYEEIATALDININTVRTRLKRAREKLLSLKDEVINYEV